MKAEWNTPEGEPPGKPDFLLSATMILFAVILVATIWWLIKLGY
jgi:hypothetical protein